MKLACLEQRTQDNSNATKTLKLRITRSYFASSWQYKGPLFSESAKKI